LAGWRANADAALVIPAGFGYLLLIVRDTTLRGRSGLGWLLACTLLAPIGLVAFLVVAVRDRVQGRRGIESYWAPGVRWCYLVAVGMATVALGLAAAQVSVTPPHIPLLPGVSPSIVSVGRVSGDCQASALGVTLGHRPGIVDSFPAGLPAQQQSELTAFERRCVEKAGRRMVASEVALAGAFTLALVGAVNARRRRPTSPTPAPVPVAA
jgi:hypothetical protein